MLDISAEASETEISDKFIVSLRDFKVLNPVKVDFGMFVDQDTGMTKRLVDVLPASVKSLTLRVEKEFDEGLDLFASLAE